MTEQFWTNERAGDADILLEKCVARCAAEGVECPTEIRRVTREIFFSVLPLINAKYATADPRTTPVKDSEEKGGEDGTSE